MANLIQIKRSTTADAPIAGSLVTGELAYSLLSTSNSLFVGDGSNNAIRIGGGKYLWLHQANVSSPGALTSNAVVVTNGNGYVTAWKTNNLIVGTDGTTVNIASISTAANSTQLGASAGGSNTELVSSYAIKTYVDGYVLAAKPIVTDTQVGFGNSSNFLTSSSDFKFNDTTDTLTIGNTTVNTSITPTTITTGGTVNATALNIGANVNVSTTQINIGNSTVNTFANSTHLQVNGTNVNNSVIGIAGQFRGYSANLATVVEVGSNVVVNTTAIAVGNTTGNVLITQGGITVGNSTVGTVNAVAMNVGANVNLTTSEIDVGNTTTNAVLTSTTIKVGSATVNTVITGSAITTTATVASGNTTVTGFVNASSYGTFGGTVNATALNIGANVNVTSDRINVGNSTVNTFITPTAIETDGTLTVLGATTLSNTLSVTGLMTMSSANLTSSLNVVGAATVNGAFLVNNTASVGNTTISGTANVTSSINVVGAATVNGALTVNNTAAVGNTTITGFANVSSTLNVVGATTVNGALTVNNTAALGNTTITGFANVSSTLQVSGNASFAQNASVTGHLSVGTFQTGDATISGNLTITGTLTTVSANNITVTDPLIQLASNNTTSDVLDIGFFGSYEAGDAGNHEHTGLFRDASDSGVYKLFQNLEPSPTTTVDTANNTFQIAMLQAFLKTGGAGASGLIANATTIALTANSTLNVAIVANTLSLSTALPGTSGGTGLASFTAEDILVANSSNGFKALAKGSEGTVLQISSGVVAYTTLDGGTF